MQITDPIADMLTRIRNAGSAKHESVDVPASKMKKAIAEILLNEGYIKNYQVIDDGTQGIIRITLKYLPGKEKAIQGLRRVSKPGLRVYAGADELRQQARPARVCRRRRAAPRSQRPGHRYHFHFQGRYDRQAGSQRACWRRSPCVHLVRR